MTKSQTSLTLKVLGCGDAFGNEGRFNTSFLLESGEESVLMDCGASTMIRLKQEHVDLEEIKIIVLSHFHGDHFGGLPFFLICSMFEKPRQAPLTIIGPQGVQGRVENLLEAMYPGTSDELKKLDIRFLDFKENSPIEIEDKRVEAFSMKHSPLSIPHGIRIHWNNKLVAFSGDTSWTENLIKVAHDADLFICECNFMSQRTPGHLCYEELLEHKNQFNAHQIYLTHMSSEVIHAGELAFPKLVDGQIIRVS